jgi:hypothetical protein
MLPSFFSWVLRSYSGIAKHSQLNIQFEDSAGNIAYGAQFRQIHFLFVLSEFFSRFLRYF